MSKVDIKAIIKDFDKEELQNLISIAQGVLTSLFSSDEISNYLAWFKFLKISKKSKNSDRIKDMLINVATKETCITINTIRNRYVELT